MQLNPKESFILYIPHIDMLIDLPDEQVGELLRGIVETLKNNTEFKPKNNEYTHAMNMAYRAITNQIRVNHQKYLNRCLLNKENGKQGGRPKKTDAFEETENNQTVSNKADNEKENEKVKEKEKEKIQDKVKEKDLKQVSFKNIIP